MPLEAYKKAFDQRMFDAAGVKYTKIKLSRDELKVSFREEDI